MKVIWTQEALEEIKEIYRFYKLKVSITVAKRIKKRILTSTRNLEKQSRKGQKEPLLNHKIDEYRYLISINYKIIYRVEESEIYIVKVFDCRRNPEDISKF